MLTLVAFKIKKLLSFLILLSDLIRKQSLPVSVLIDFKHFQ